jgi:hypothetical protein
MNTEILLISSIIFLAVISIVLGITNWILLSSTSLKITLLEEEIEKKAKEFDALKKERIAASPPLLDKQGFADNSPSNSFVSQKSQDIEIVRNVRAEFKQTDIEPTSDILDIVDDGPRRAPQKHYQKNGIEIMLFSPSKKDTDFTLAWQKITEFLPRAAPSALIVINFINVMFLYEKELHYLEKIYKIVAMEQGKLSFINCDPELKQTILQRPLLAPLIKE